MTFAGLKLCVAIPDTVLEEHSGLRDKTVKLGAMARSCAIYGVDLIQVFRDPRGRGEASLIKNILSYLETPQYLRRELFEFDESLKYAGLLPPLRIPSHKSKVPVEKLKVGEYREGAVVRGSEIDIGLDKTLRLTAPSPLRGRVTVRVSRVSPLEGVLASREDTGEYWGYKLEVNDINDVLSDGRFRIKIATSRRGERIQDAVERIGQTMGTADSVKLVFGSPSRGLSEIIGGDLRKRVDFVVNLFVEQHVATVRTEETIASALALLNAVMALRETKT